MVLDKRTLSVIIHNPQGKIEKMEIPLTKEIKKELKRIDKLSCKCEKPDDCPSFVKNYKGVSHGYICKKCGKFVQFG